MKRLKKLSLALSLVLICTSCITTSPDDADNNAPPDDLSELDKGAASSNASADTSLEGDLDKPDQAAGKQQAADTQPKDDFAQFDDSNNNQNQAQNQAADQQQGQAPAQKDEFAQFDDQNNQGQQPDQTQGLEQAQQPVPPPLENPPQEAQQQPVPPPEEPPKLDQTPAPPPEFNAQNEVPPEPKPEPPAEAQAQPSGGPVTIKNVEFKANDSGGTVVVDADGPMTYTTRMSAANGQYIVDIPNSVLPKRLRRGLVTKDFDGPVGAVDAYQSPGSNVSRIVVHLKPGAPEPVVQAEGNSLLVVENGPAQENQASAAAKEEPKILSYNSLEEFMAGDMVFSGKKISIESRGIEVGELLTMISDEVGVNLVAGDDIKQTMSVKLKQVPWDQALVMIMKANKLSYTRTGNVLRIAPIRVLREEEDDLVKMVNAKKDIAPLIIKMVPISYAKVTDIIDQVKPFLSEKRGKVIADPRTSAVVVSDVEENLQRILKIIAAIDIPPQQVLIEGKVVEAQENFQRQLGIQWNFSGLPMNVGSSSVSQITTSTGVSISTGSVTNPTGQLNFNLGVLDVLGELTATLNLQETEGLVKILSSPRIVTLHNEEAVISQTQEIPLITSTVSNGVVNNTVTFKPVTLDLKVTPNITNDGAVLLKVDVKREFAGGIVDQNTQARPINGRQAVTKVMVRNGQTAVIGGIYQDDSTDTETRVPWLGSLPIFGWLFKNKAQTESKNELLIFLTPRILGQLDGQAIPQQQSIDQGVQ